MQIKFENLSHIYGKNTPFSSKAIYDINLELSGHFFAALIGHTGSGKSTLIQHINGLLVPSEGSVSFDQYKIYTLKDKSYYIDTSLTKPKLFHKRKQFDIKKLRKKAGLVFQFPEYQLFESSVLKDVSYGPLNFKVDEKEAENKAKIALDLVGLDSSYYQRSPFELSGGEKRRVAIAGILAMDPDVLILDEPTAGLDPEGEKSMMELFNKIYQSGKNIVLVTHNMEIVFKYVQKVILMDDGKIVSIDTPLNIFRNKELMSKTSIRPPEVFNLSMALIENGLDLNIENIKDIPSLADEIKRVKNNV